jgi:hypothetical protein
MANDSDKEFHRRAGFAQAVCARTLFIRASLYENA